MGKRRNDTSKLFRSLIEDAPLLVTLVDSSGTIRFANAAARWMLGRSPDELIGGEFTDLVHPDDAARCAEFLNPAEEDDGVRRIENRYRRKDGSEFWGDLCATLIRGRDGEPRGMIGIIIDISERKHVEQALRSSESRYRQLVERNLAGVFRSTIDGDIVECNAAFARIFGCDTPTDLMSHREQELYPSPAARHNLLHRIRQTGELVNHEMVMVRSDGTPVWVLANISLAADEHGEQSLLEGTMIDISERKQAEDRLLLHSKALESTSSAIVITDPTGIIQWVNPAFSWLTGYPAEEVIGKHTRILKSGRHSDSVYRELWQTVSSGGAWHGELTNRRKDGTLYTQEMTITPVRGAYGEVDYFIAVMQDVTDRRLMEERLRQSHKMEAVGRLAGGVAHDFNNLLQAMLGLSEQIRRPGSDPDQTTVKLQELEGHIQRASQLTRQLLLFSRPESSRQELIDLNQVVDETVRLLRRLVRENIVLTLDPSPRPLAIEADRGQLEQIVMNLALNAADAMPEGGRMRIRTGAGDGHEVWLEVQDTGHGIPDDIRDHLFEPFFTTKERGRGTGLGLSVVHGIVTVHGGRIRIDSAPGAGATFRITLPGVDPSRLPAAPAARPSSDITGSGERVLIVEDDPVVRGSLHEILTHLGYVVITAANRAEAQALPVAPGFDLLLSDFGLPDGTGTEIAALLQIRWPALKVIIMSGYAEDDVIARHVMNGDLHFLQKPFTVETLGRAVRSVLSNRPPVGASDSPTTAG
jgi:PAS domain S-box-containing protein